MNVRAIANVFFRIPLFFESAVGELRSEFNLPQIAGPTHLNQKKLYMDGLLIGTNSRNPTGPLVLRLLRTRP